MSGWVRRVHRWASAAFALAVAAVFAALALGEPPPWLYYLPLPPLFVLMPTGLWMFALPYLGRGRARG